LYCKEYEPNFIKRTIFKEFIVVVEEEEEEEEEEKVICLLKDFFLG